MKYSILRFSLITSLLSLVVIACQTNKKTEVPFDAEKFVPTYKLIVPENWGTERFAIPIEFAPSIPYVGIEELRFAPGWPDSTREDYWTYAYLWYLKGKPVLTAEMIEKNLEAYYTGLVGRNIEKRKILKGKLFPVEAKFENAETRTGDVSTFRGAVHMLDYMAQKPMVLNCLVHVKECEGKDDTLVFYEVSPRDETHPIWKTLNGIWEQFQCDAK